MTLQRSSLARVSQYTCKWFCTKKTRQPRPFLCASSSRSPPHFPRSWGRGTRPAVGLCSCAMDLCGSPDGQTMLNCCHSGPEQQLTVGSATAPPGPGAASPGAVQHPRGMKRLGHLTSASECFLSCAVADENHPFQQPMGCTSRAEAPFPTPTPLTQPASVPERKKKSQAHRAAGVAGQVGGCVEGWGTWAR